MGDFVKTNDQQLRAQLELFKNVVTPAAVSYDVTTTDMAAFGSGLAGFISALDAHVAGQETAKSKTEAKGGLQVLDRRDQKTGRHHPGHSPTVTPAMKQLQPTRPGRRNRGSFTSSSFPTSGLRVLRGQCASRVMQARAAA